MNPRALLLALFAAACVPAAEERDPRGGVLVRLTPSAATAGQPFTSVDGWTVTIDRFAMRAVAVAVATGPLIETISDWGTPVSVPRRGAVGVPRVINPTQGCDLKASAMLPGPAEAGVGLASTYADSSDDNASEPCGVDFATLARFAPVATGSFVTESTETTWGPTRAVMKIPNVILIAHAEKGGRKLQLDLELAVAAHSADTREGGLQPVTIAPNRGALAQETVRAETLFAPTASAPYHGQRYGAEQPFAIELDALAAADSDEDGVVTTAETKQADIACSVGGTPDGQCTLFTALSEWNVAHLFRSRE